MKGKNIFKFIKQVNRSYRFYSKDTKVISPSLVDTFGRQHTYLRVSLTEKCSFRCQYCMPAEGVTLTPKERLLTSDEVVKLISLFVKSGVTKVRFTGGEPLLRKDLAEIIKTVSSLEGLDTIALTTNAFVLDWKIEALKEAGLNAVNISLDTLIPAKFEFVTRMKGLNRVLKGIEAAIDIGYNPVKINCVVMRGFNDDELPSFVKLTEDKNLDVRFIEYSPFGGNNFSNNKMVPYSRMLDIIRETYPDLERLRGACNDTAKAYKVPGFRGQIGFITSMTENFCSSCNRLRITADGNLKVCLFGKEEVSLRDALRNNASEEDLLNIIAAAVSLKKKQHAENKKAVRTVSRTKSKTSYFPSVSKTISKTSYFPSKYLLPYYASMAAFSTHGLTHTNEDGKLNMVDVGSKLDTNRLAEAEAVVYLGATAYNLVVQNKMKKGDVLTVAKIAGIMAAKKTSELIPLCHCIKIDCVDLKMDLNDDNHSVTIRSTVRASDRTGVEMEALTSATIAALTIYDMCKSVSKGIEIKSVKLLMKKGGKNDYEH